MLLIPEGLKGVESSYFVVFLPTSSFEVVVEVTLPVYIAFSWLLINHEIEDTVIMAVIQVKPILQHSQNGKWFYYV